MEASSGNRATSLGDRFAQRYYYCCCPARSEYAKAKKRRGLQDTPKPPTHI